MTETPEQQDEGSAGGGQFADPNREAVGVEPAWAEGYGGEPGAGPTPDPEPGPDPDPDPVPDGDPLDDMTKDELTAEAGRRGVDVKADWTKADIRKAIDTA